MSSPIDEILGYNSSEEREAQAPAQATAGMASDDSDNDMNVDAFIEKFSKKRKKKRVGPPSTWKTEWDTDFCDIVMNDQRYIQRLIKTNGQPAKNAHLYEEIAAELKQRHPDFDKTLGQVRTHFKGMLSKCRKRIFTVKTASGIKKIEDDNTWMPILLPAVKEQECMDLTQIKESSINLEKAGEEENIEAEDN